jgi:hypothetical protein
VTVCSPAMLILIVCDIVQLVLVSSVITKYWVKGKGFRTNAVTPFPNVMLLPVNVHPGIPRVNAYLSSQIPLYPFVPLNGLIKVPFTTGTAPTKYGLKFLFVECMPDVIFI